MVSCAWGRFSLDPADSRGGQCDFRDFTGLDFLVLAGRTGVRRCIPPPGSYRAPWSSGPGCGTRRFRSMMKANTFPGSSWRVLVSFSAPDPAARSYYRPELRGSGRRRSDQARRSRFRSLELITSRMLAIEDSPRVRQACVGYWRRYVHDFYPAPAKLIRRAKAEGDGWADNRSPADGSKASRTRPSVGLENCLAPEIPSAPMSGRKILILTASHLCRNPRVVKEATWVRPVMKLR